MTLKIQQTDWANRIQNDHERKCEYYTQIIMAKTLVFLFP